MFQNSTSMPSTLPVPDASQAFYRPDEWGTPTYAVSTDSGCDVEQLRAPEGLVLISRCSRCGARLEGLIDLRAHRISRWVPVPDSGSPLLTKLRDHADWVCDHQCLPGLGANSLPPKVQRMMDADVNAGREILAAGAMVRSTLRLHFANGSVTKFALDSVLGVEGSPGRVAKAAVAFGVRELVRARGIPLLAAVCMAEVWAAPMEGADSPEPRDSPSRREYLAVSLVTPEVGQLTFHPIIRASGIQGEGSGSLGEPVTVPPSHQTLFDGLFAAASGT